MLRDKAGLAILFVMPMALILIMTLLQDNTFKALEENKIEILLVNKDSGTLGKAIHKGLTEADFFQITDKLEDDTLTEKSAYKKVASGAYQMAIVIPEGATDYIQQVVTHKINTQLPGLQEPVEEDTKIDLTKGVNVKIFFDPVTKNSFKQSVHSALKEFTSKIEAEMAFNIYGKLFKDMFEIEVQQPESFSSIITFTEEYATNLNSKIIPNSVQHNVPAWTLFAMFFIVIPLAGNIIKERESGNVLRLKTMPGSYTAVLLGKLSIYLIICIIQAALMIAIGVYILPLFGLPSLMLGTNLFALFIIVLAAALAATGFGVAIGSIATSHDQASIFGAVSTVILAALGGIWVPVFIMPEVMQQISILSPLNWALNGFYDIFLRDSGTLDIMPYVIKLMIFCIVSIGVSYFYNKFNRSIS